jgi:hypothetical protein
MKYVDNVGLFWNFKVIMPFKRGRSMQSLVERKKATFEIILHRGMFGGGDVSLAVATLPLSDLNSKISCGGLSLPLTRDGRGKNVGGVLSAFVNIRTPVSTPDVLVTEDRRLVVESWPEVPSASSSVSAGPVQEPSSASHSPAAAAEPHVSSPATPAPAVVNPYASQLTEKERADPLSVDFLESNDVMDGEVESIQAQLANPSSLSEEDLLDLGLRLQLIQGKLGILVANVQNEKLSLADYLSMIKERLRRDKILALYCKAEGDNATAVKIMKRIKVMQSEIENAEANN